MSLFTVIAVGLGGSLGTLMRVICSKVLNARIHTTWPWPTFCINITACFAIAFATTFLSNTTLELFVCVGVLGGFSTMSTLNVEAVTLFEKRDYKTCALYLAVTYATCLLGTFLGYTICHALV